MKLPDRQGTLPLSLMLPIWLRLGCINLGGITAHIALMHEELVERRGLIEPEFFQAALGFCSLLPGPEATQLAIYLGYKLAGRRGGILAGLCFILPALVLFWVLNAAYVRFGASPVLAAVLQDLRPVVVALIAASLYKLSRESLRSKVIGLLLLR